MTMVTLDAVVHDPHMHAVFLKYLSTNDPKNFARLLFLVSVDEFKKLVPDEGSNNSPTTQRVNYAKKIIKKYMDEESFLYIGNDGELLLQDGKQSIATFGSLLHHDLNVCAGLSSNRDLFLDAETAILSAMEPSFLAFSETKEFQSLVSMEIMVPTIEEVEFQHATTTFTLERVLANRRLCCVFWLFLFKERTHGPLSFWMEITHRVLPQLDAFCQHPTDSKSLVHLGYLIQKKYFLPGATAEVHVVGDVQSQLVADLQVELAAWTRGDLSRAPDTAQLFRQLLRHVKETLQMNHFVRFIQSPSFHSMLLSPSKRLCLSPNKTPQLQQRSPSSSSGSSGSSTGSTSLQDVFHVMNVLSHQQPLEPPRSARLLSSASACISGVLHFNLHPVNRNTFEVSTLYSLADDIECSEAMRHHHALPDHLDAFFTPYQPSLVRSQRQPTPSLFHLTIGSTDRPFYMVCLTRYVSITTPGQLNPLEQVLFEQKNLQLFVLTGVCMLSRYPLFETMRARLSELHADSLTSMPEYTTNLEWRPSPEQIQALVAPAVPSMEVSIHTLFTCLRLPNVLHLLASLLCERKVLLVSSHISVLTTVAESARLLLRPLQWPHVFCPVLPEKMLECLHCPTPFLFGVHKELLTSLDNMLDNDLVIVDLDCDTIKAKSPLVLPQSAVLQAKLQLLLHPHVACSDWVSPATARDGTFPDAEVLALFQASWKSMMDDMEEYSFVLSDEGESMVVFDSIGFLQRTSKEHAHFYQVFLKTQLFSQYIATNGSQQL